MWVCRLVLAALFLAATIQSLDAVELDTKTSHIDANLREKKRVLDAYLTKVRDWTPSSDEGELPIGLTEAEEETMARRRHLGIFSRRGVQPGDPPSNPSFVPEWAPMQGVLIRYPFGLSLELIKTMSETVTIYCLVKASLQNEASTSMSGAGVDPAAVEWIIGPTNSYWTRDYGPWFVYTDDAAAAENGGIAIVNHVYNRPRQNDDEAPLKVANHIGIPYFDSRIMGTGGNFMVDGLGQAAATQIAYTENDSCQTNDYTSVPLSQCSSVDGMLLDYFGIGVFHVVSDPNNDYIDHIDCWGKYLSPTTILMREVSLNHPQYNEIETVADYFKNAKTSNGGLWTMHRVMTNSDQPYTNSLILNDQVYVPVVGSSGDEAALQVYREAMPGYNISGWSGTWQSTDALHCRVRGIAKPLVGVPTSAPTTSSTPTLLTSASPTLTRCGNGVCDDPEETCTSCPADCEATSAGAVCGNGICEGAGDTNGDPTKVEDTITCPRDCNGRKKGRRRKRWYCGGAYGCDGSNPKDSSITCFNGDPTTCTMVPTPVGSTCCGDSMCNGIESSFTCSRDCGDVVP